MLQRQRSAVFFRGDGTHPRDAWSVSSPGAAMALPLEPLGCSSVVPPIAYVCSPDPAAL